MNEPWEVLVPNRLPAASSRRPAKDHQTPDTRNQTRRTAYRLLATGCWLLLLTVGTLQAQYFGRNKVQYERFDWKVMHTEHFDIHYYPEAEAAVKDVARMAERWYTRLSTILDHRFRERKPLIIYANQGDFQQTNVISGMIGEGTGGVTESAKDRVTLPLTGSYAENDHVLGHELVHAFQYDIGGSSRGSQLFQLPLWFIEGMAEYFSVGRHDPHTAMWLRDAIERNDLPTLEQLTTDMKYFPYRYGEAFWAYVGGRWGDTVIGRVLKEAVRVGWKSALARATRMSDDSLSSEWIAAIRRDYEPLLAGRSRASSIARAVVAEKGTLSVAPSVSPDGRTMAVLSSRDLFTIDLYLADATTGETIKKLVGENSDPHVDAIRFINSAGSWSPDGRRFAFVRYAGGDDELAIVDVATRSIEREMRVPQVGSISNPSWSPDGSKLVFSGIKGGISDLFILDLASGDVRQLTRDLYADLQPAWSPDGTTIAFVTDRGTATDVSKLKFAELSLATCDVSSGSVRLLNANPESKNINPQWSPDGREIYFVSDRNGFSDLYRYTLSSGSVTAMTNLTTGISGIGSTSPAMSVARNTGQILYSVYENGNYAIYSMAPTAVAANAGGSSSVNAGNLPPINPTAPQLVTRYLEDPSGLPTTEATITDYKPSLGLDYLGSPTIGVAVDGYGSSLGGGIAGYFSDMLGNHQVGANLQVSGSLIDIGAGVFYANLSNRLNWGVSATHQPYIIPQSFSTPVTVTLDGQTYAAEQIDQVLTRQFVDEANLMVSYPFSTTMRLEAQGGYMHVGYSRELARYVVIGNEIVSEQEFDAEAPSGLNFFQSSMALVGDYSNFGFTSPVEGGRYRFEVQGTTGSATFAGLLLDYRKYFFARPVTLAMRGYHFGRYGPGAEGDLVSPLYIGYESFVRGYGATSFNIAECTGGENGACPEFDRLAGSRIAVANVELRVPLLGTSEFGLIDFPYLPTELSFFADGGTAWSAGQSPTLRFDRHTTERVPVFSTGVSARINLMGSFILELFYAYAWQRPHDPWQFGFQIAPGW